MRALDHMECDRGRKWNHRKERPANDGNNQQKGGKRRKSNKKEDRMKRMGL